MTASSKKKENSAKNDTSFLQSLDKIERTPTRPFVQTEAKKRDSRIFEYTHVSEEMANHAALGYFQINDTSLLKCDTLKTGRKKFIFFGRSKKTFKYTIKPLLTKIIVPFLQEIFKLTRLNIRSNVTARNMMINIHLSGEDQWIFTKGGSDIFNALETIVKIYTAKKIFLSRNTRFQIECNKKDASRGPFTKHNRDDIKSDKDLISKVEKLKAEILSTGKSQVLKFLSPSQRKIVHLHIDEDAQFTTRSLGEGHYKRIEIELK